MSITFRELLPVKVWSCLAELKQVSFLPYPGSKRPRTDCDCVIKSQPRLIDISVQDDAFQENVDIDEASTLDVMIEDVGPLIYESHLWEEFDIDREWDSHKDSKEDADDDCDEDSDI
ncbi:hypothetical protein M9H77_02069 [Catharanthus roseus]|uniref:Uncharacterized protein n=1 Tax=Catharanthus roseus TaxID=4058 RepID=A0ACC0C7D0_CATRO|nr:hypothetical protein M9H77_02069 [Catharanthus roseus]